MQLLELYKKSKYSNPSTTVNFRTSGRLPPMFMWLPRYLALCIRGFLPRQRKMAMTFTRSPHLLQQCFDGTLNLVYSFLITTAGLHSVVTSHFLRLTIFINRARGGAVGWGTAQQAGRSRNRFPMMSSDFFYCNNFSGRTMSLGLIQPLRKMSTRNISWGVKAAGA
jgi:hypothetical protein